MSGQRNSVGQLDVQQGDFTQVQPQPLLSKLLDDEHYCHKEVPGKLEPSQAKGECLAFLQPANHSSPGDSVVTHKSLPAHSLNCQTTPLLQLTKSP